ncbi:MAG TPA: Rpn family recombination-promoting nuclease/putative transposase [Skermanella sp.]|nr:Rpn family recombination-promoting nuclease/putative transposase [Skermanella sp.]
MTQTGSLHDHLIKLLLGRPATAATFLRERLPPDIVALMAPEPPELMPGSFIDSGRRSHHTDLLFRLALTGGRSAFVPVLIEHVSRRRSHPVVLPKLMRYMALMGEKHLEDGHGLPLPPVIPLVIYQGAKPWNEAPNYAGLYDVDAPLAPFVPDFAYLMFDLGATPDEDLSAQAFLRFGFAVLKFARGAPDFAGRLLALATEDVYRDDRVLALLRYIAEVYAEVDRTTMDALIAPLANEEHLQMTTLLQRLFAEGKAEGLAEGRVEAFREGEANGLRKGKADSLRIVLEQKFGPPPQEMLEKIEDADLPTLEGWMRRGVLAASLDEVTDPNRA